METPMASNSDGGREGQIPWWDWMLPALIWILIVGWAMPLRDALLIGGDEGYELAKAAHLLREGTFPAETWNDQPLTHTRLYAALFRMTYGPLGPRVWSLICSGLLVA